MAALTSPAGRFDVPPTVAFPRAVRPCMVSYYFHPSYSGSAIQALSLSRHLIELGAKPMIVAANLTNSPERERIDGIPVHRLRVARARELRIPSFWVALARFLGRHRREFDVIHAHGTLQHGSAAVAGRWLGKPSILKIAMAMSDIAFERQGRLRGTLNHRMVAQFDRYIATTSEIASEFGPQGLDPGKVRLIPNGVDTDLFAPLDRARKDALRRELGLPPGPLVTYVGIVNRRKNVDGTLRVWSEAVTRGASGHLLIVGPLDETDSFTGELQSFVREKSLGDRVTFLGFKDPVVPYLKVSDVFLFPSRQEGMPNSVLEAMACGLACIVSRSAGISAVVEHGTTGLAVDIADEVALAAAVTELTRNRERREALGAAAREFVEKQFALRAIARRYMELYRELLPDLLRRRTHD
jgi:glycosyltransferase involved in cell wall biosynthesis